MKTILCYGDSNTWGAIPNKDERYSRNVRYPGVLQDLLGKDFEVVNEGLPGRTLAAIDPAKPQRTGITHLQAILETHDPLDLVIIMLGTNDVKNTYNLSAEEISADLEKTVNLIQQNQSLLRIPRILVVCPPTVIVPTENELDERMVPGIELFKALPSLYKAVAEKYGCLFLNAGDIISSSKVDGYHLDADAHLKLASKLSEIVNKILK